jgi:hypothetical protein
VPPHDFDGRERSPERRQLGYCTSMNKMERELRPEGLAEIEYLDGEYRVIRPGSFVICAVTGVHIPLEALRYWSVDLQEAYASPAASLKRMQETGRTPR